MTTSFAPTDTLDWQFIAAARPDQVDRTARALVAHNFSVEVVPDARAARARAAALLPDRAGVLTAASETLRLSGIESDINESGRFVPVRSRLRALDLDSSQLPCHLSDPRPRARAAYGRPSAVNKLLIVNAEPFPGRTTVLLVREGPRLLTKGYCYVANTTAYARVSAGCHTSGTGGACRPLAKTRYAAQSARPDGACSGCVPGIHGLVQGARPVCHPRSESAERDFADRCCRRQIRLRTGAQ
jgi:hypothetical protein